jgi:hypothetical protein
MHEIEIIGIGIALTFIIHSLCFSLIEKGWLKDKEPFNCFFCISLWITIGLTVITFNWYAVFIPILTHYSIKLLDKWT